jgi:hypothetical protein
VGLFDKPVGLQVSQKTLVSPWNPRFLLFLFYTLVVQLKFLNNSIIMNGGDWRSSPKTRLVLRNAWKRRSKVRFFPQIQGGFSKNRSFGKALEVIEINEKAWFFLPRG